MIRLQERSQFKGRIIAELILCYKLQHNLVDVDHHSVLHRLILERLLILFSLFIGFAIVETIFFYKGFKGNNHILSCNMVWRF